MVSEESIYFPYVKLGIQNGVFCWFLGNVFSRGFFVRGVAHRSKRHTHSLRPIRLTLTAPIDFSARRCERMRKRDGLPPEWTISGLSQSRDLSVMGSKAEPATALKSAAERRSSPAPPRRQFDHVTSFLKGWASSFLKGWASLMARIPAGLNFRERQGRRDRARSFASKMHLLHRQRYVLFGGVRTGF